MMGSHVPVQVVLGHLTPSHVLLFDYPRFCAKLTGFSKASTLPQPHADVVLATEVHAYSPPEAVLTQQYNAAADIWALGVIRLAAWDVP